MPFRTHPELAKLFESLPAPTCAACILRDYPITNRDALIDTFERLAKNASYLKQDICAVCHIHKAVIFPNSSD